MLKWQLLP